MSDVNTNDILDATLDDLEDLPKFEPFPAGAHRVLVSLDRKEVNGHDSVEVSMKMIETLELAEPTKDEVPKQGDTANTLCMLDNEYGRGNLKEIATPIGLSLGIAVLRDVIEAANDIECIVVTSIRLDKNDKTIKRLNIKELQVV